MKKHEKKENIEMERVKMRDLSLDDLNLYVRTKSIRLK